MNGFTTFFGGCDWVGWGHVVSCLRSTGSSSMDVLSSWVRLAGRCLRGFGGVKLSWCMYFSLVMGVFWGSTILEIGFVGFG
ncbi:hypothetical protein BDV41DRAFT_528816, partial [Aspergillus transmontanensis]